MNKSKIRGVAMALLTGELATRKKNPLGFNQRTFRDENGLRNDMTGHNCSTVACIAGWTTAIYAPRVKEINHISARARKILGISGALASDLFDGHPSVGGSGTVSHKVAALVLFHLAETGKVDWSIAKGLA